MAVVEKYGFDVKSGGYTEYKGILDGKICESVTVTKTDATDERRTVVWKFDDGHSFTVSARHQVIDGGEKLSEIERSWV